MIAAARRYGLGAVSGVGLAILAYAGTEALGAPTLLIALILGMAAAPLLTRPALRPGTDLLAKPLLRLGVALMGFRITIADLQALGWEPALVAASASGLTLVLGYALARALGLARSTAFLTAGAVAICGASAALAIATVLARRPGATVERDVVATVAAITLIGTAAAVLYPALCHQLGLGPIPSAVFLGASIHEVAQVVAAADVYGEAAGPAAATVKMIRVAMMPVVIFGLVMLLAWRDRRDGAEAAEATVPVFLLGFVAAIVVANVGWITPAGLAALSEASGWCLVVSMVALGAQSSVKGVLALGPRAVVALAGQTVLIAGLAAAGVWLMTALR